VTKAPDVNGWDDLCDPAYAGKTSMRLRRTILLGTAFAMGKDPFALYSDPEAYQAMLDEVEAKLIECKANIKAFWEGGTDLEAMLLSGEVVASEAWDQTAFKLTQANPDIRYVPPETGALTWIDTFTIPAKGEADDAAYKWINFVMRPEIAAQITEASGSFASSKGSEELVSASLKKAYKEAFTPAVIANIKWFPAIPAGLEDVEGKILDRISAK
jgi:spermidine/putrescine transport system substrate-binding protein